VDEVSSQISFFGCCGDSVLKKRVAPHACKRERERDIDDDTVKQFIIW
jgi:hypothetical protein